jgi:hypothetical protein
LISVSLILFLYSSSDSSSPCSSSGTHEDLLRDEPRYSEILAQQSTTETPEEEQGEEESDEEYRKRISETLIKDPSEDEFKGGFDESGS